MSPYLPMGPYFERRRQMLLVWGNYILSGILFSSLFLDFLVFLILSHFRATVVCFYCGAVTREDFSDMGLSQEKIFISQLATALGVQDPSVAPHLSQDELLNTKVMS